MQAVVEEVTNSMSPLGNLIGSASEVYVENSAHKEDFLLSTNHGRGIGLSLSPTTVFQEEGMYSPESRSLFFDSPLEEKNVKHDYETKLNLTEIVMQTLTRSGKTPLDIFSELDSEKEGVLAEKTLRKGLSSYGITLTDTEFSLVFSGFMEGAFVNYLRFLHSWAEFSSDIDTPFSLKRSSTDELKNICDTVDGSPKRRPQLVHFDEHEQEKLKEKLRVCIVQIFGNSNGIFNELQDQDGYVYLSDLAKYFSSRGVSCTINQLCILFASFCDGRNKVTLEEFQKFIQSLKCDTDQTIVKAFPQTFGRTLHIRLLPRQSSLSCDQPLHHVPSVARNLNHLPLYRLMLDMNELPLVTEEDAVSI